MMTYLWTLDQAGPMRRWQASTASYVFGLSRSLPRDNVAWEAVIERYNLEPIPWPKRSWS